MSRVIALGCISFLFLAVLPAHTEAAEPAASAYAECEGLRSTKRLQCKQQVSVRREEVRRRESIARRALKKRPEAVSGVPSKITKQRARRASATGRKMSARSIKSEVIRQLESRRSGGR